MAHIVWTVVVAALEEKLRGSVHVYSPRVAGTESWDEDDNKVLWTHLCHPRKICRWIRRGDESDPFPEVKMIFNGKDPDNQIRMEVNGKSTGCTKDILFEVDWLTHTMVITDLECRSCGYELTKQEKVLLSLLALGRRR
jgi:hypothetical protein